MTAKSKKKTGNDKIAVNRKASHDYFIEQRLEAGVSLQGWEVKSLRAGRLQLNESYIYVKKGEAYLFGAHIAPLTSASTHVKPEPARTRKLLLHRREIDRLQSYREREGYTLVPLSLYWRKNRVKCEIGLAKGKKQHDKRAVVKEREWQIDKRRALKRR